MKNKILKMSLLFSILILVIFYTKLNYFIGNDITITSFKYYYTKNQIINLTLTLKPFYSLNGKDINLNVEKIVGFAHSDTNISYTCYYDNGILVFRPSKPGSSYILEDKEKIQTIFGNTLDLELAKRSKFFDK